MPCMALDKLKSWRQRSVGALGQHHSHGKPCPGIRGARAGDQQDTPVYSQHP